MPTHTGEGHLFYLVFITVLMLMFSRDTLKDTLKIMFYQLSGHPMAQSSRHIKQTIVNLLITVLLSKRPYKTMTPIK